MGDPRRLKKTYETPAHPWQKERLAFEIGLLEEYGLKNKREIWKAGSILRGYTSQAKKLILATTEHSKIDDVLSLNIKNILDRRLQTIVFKKNLAYSIYQARQFISHGHIQINNRKIDVPSYFVSREEESNVQISKSNILKILESKNKKEDLKNEIKNNKEVINEVAS